MATLLSRLIGRTGKEPAKNSRIAQILYRKGVERSSELDRILALPRRVLDLAVIPDLTPLYLHTEFCAEGCDLCRKGPAKLRPLQSAILLEAERMRGALGPLGVGKGKTLASLLLVDAVGGKKAVLLIPPDVRDQLITVDIPKLQQHFTLPLDRLRVVAYSQLSRAETAGVLDEIKPDVIIADEAHALRHKTSARTARFLRYMKENPGTIFIPLSGTMTTKSIRDYAHLSELALRKSSPLPHGYRELESWSDALDTVKGDAEPMPPGALLSLCSSEELDAVSNGTLTGTKAAHAGFRRRLIQTPGVVATEDADDFGVSLNIRKRVLDVPTTVKAALHELERTWSIGDDEIDSAATMAARAREVSCGFYYVWDWPNGVVDREWMEARRAWNRAVRTYLTYNSKPGFDSPMLVANAASRGQLKQVATEWADWSKVKDRPTPPTKPVWIDDFMMRDICLWAEEHARDRETGIIWYTHQAVEVWLSVYSEIPVFGAGTSADLIAIAGDKYREIGLHGVIACSVHSHRKGKNLQTHWSNCLFASNMASGEAWEQAIGRVHRPGQQADEVNVDIYLHTEAAIGAWQAAIASAHYVEERSAAGPQKILYAQKLFSV